MECTYIGFGFEVLAGFTFTWQKMFSLWILTFAFFFPQFQRFGPLNLSQVLFPHCCGFLWSVTNNPAGMRLIVQ